MLRTVAVSMISLSIPLALRWIPRNPVYGYRTPETLASDERWYRVNQTAGLFCCLGGLWLIGLSFLAPGFRWDWPTVFANVYLILPVGVAAIGLRRYINRHPRHQAP